MRLRRSFFDSAVADLARPHSFALERVAFAYCRWARADGGLLVFPVEYEPVPDGDYVEGEFGAATIGASAIRRALKKTHSSQMGCLHLHLHDHSGRTGFSPVDLNMLNTLAPPMQGSAPAAPHGGMVFSRDSGAALVWEPGKKTPTLSDLSIIGFPFHSSRSWFHERKS